MSRTVLKPQIKGLHTYPVQPSLLCPPTFKPCRKTINNNTHVIYFGQCHNCLKTPPSPLALPIPTFNLYFVSLCLSVYIHCLLNVYSLSTQFIFSIFWVWTQCLLIVYSVCIQCLFSVYSVSTDYLHIVFSVSTQYLVNVFFSVNSVSDRCLRNVC